MIKYGNSEPIKRYTLGDLKTINIFEEERKTSELIRASRATMQYIWPCEEEEPAIEDGVAELTIQESSPRHYGPTESEKPIILETYYAQVNESEVC